MSDPQRCQLTIKDCSILETLLERSAIHDEAYLRLLRRKLSAAKVVFPDAIAPEVATINSRVDFTVDDGPADNRILIHGKDHAFPGLTLPVTTLRGLALLGLAAGEAITVKRRDGGEETIRLDRVAHQPEASRKGRPYQSSRMETGLAAVERSSVVLLSSRRTPAPVGPNVLPLRHDDDDPGPSAA
ncbi:MAG: nucleoside-diphosphate kinase [Rhizobiaceae bacterium]|jgi:regulator of nucleoside diphosphate kinase|nr:MAG: nucleoside-diphosphate kinase [Rhizobiaceae bacterium]